MKKLLWRCLFWGTWPLIWVYSPIHARARAFVIDGDTFLVVKPYFGSGKWQLPGGGIKFNESPIYAAAREVKEETGFTVEPKHLKPLLTGKSYIENGLCKRYVIFWVQLKNKQMSHINDHEIIDLAWLPINGDLYNCAPHVEEAVAAYLSEVNS